MSQQHWVTIRTTSRQEIAALRAQDLELLRATVRQRAPQQWVVDALLSREQMDELRQRGYKVFVRRANIQQSVKAMERPTALLEDLQAIASEGYLSVSAIEQAIQLLAQTYPELCQVVALPHPTHEDRKSLALRVGVASSTPKPGLLLLGGAHARELVNPDMLLFWTREICQAYSAQQDLHLGAVSYSAAQVRAILEQLDVVVFPLINPDGRAYVQASTGNPMWRKNRNTNPGFFCEGVDINRNFDFLWSSGIGTSDNSCSDVFRGTGPFSEPETQNVQHLMKEFPHLRCVVDVHSYSELILYPWGDDDTQTDNPAMNFRNDAYKGHRGVLGDSSYREYMPAPHLQWYRDTGDKIQQAIAAVRGREYALVPSAELYPTTGTAGDYPYAFALASEAEQPLYSFTIETGREFQPPMSEAREIILEVSSGLVALGLALLS